MIVDVELTMLQKQYYRALFEKNRSFLYKGCAKGNTPMLTNLHMELRKCCNHPYLIRGVEERQQWDDAAVVADAADAAAAAGGGAPTQVRGSQLIAASGKLVFLNKLLPKLRAEGHRVLIFSQMVRMLDILEDYLASQEMSCERLDGGTSGNERQASIDRFMDPKSDAFAFLLSTRAGGVGINLTAADTVVIFDSDWNPQNDIQALARCHRIGQTKKVSVYRLLTRGTYEGEMFKAATRKVSFLLCTVTFNANLAHSLTRSP